MTNMTDKDFTPKGLKIEGPYENDRNAQNAQLFKDILHEACGDGDVIIGHHLIYVTEETRDDGYTYQIVEEIPSADTLIFDHVIAEKIWGDQFQDVLAQLAITPISHRDEYLKRLYYSRPGKSKAA